MVLGAGAGRRGREKGTEREYCIVIAGESQRGEYGKHQGFIQFEVRFFLVSPSTTRSPSPPISSPHSFASENVICKVFSLPAYIYGPCSILSTTPREKKQRLIISILLFPYHPSSTALLSLPCLLLPRPYCP